MSTSISLSPHFEGFIRQQIESGRYNNVSEVIRAGLRALEEREQMLHLNEMKLAITKGVDSGEGLDADTVFNKLSAKYKKMSQQEIK